MHNFKRVAAIHDLSGVGRCSLSVIIPTLSVMGVQVCSVPTAILSTHTRGFGEVVLEDTTSFMPKALQHYKTADVPFDCIYSGFLASSEQVSHCLEYFKAYPDALKVVDPVMGDNGNRYKTYTEELCNKMSKLVEVADIITPNLTEASILLNQEYPVSQLTISEVKSMLVKLASKGPKVVVITSVIMQGGKMCNLGYDKENNAFWRVEYNMIPKHYPGTGDIFASVLTGGLLLGDSLPIAICRATEFCEHTIKTTFSYGTDPREGVMLEKCLPLLIQPASYANYSAM